jgi:hypothetical protein
VAVAADLFLDHFGVSLNMILDVLNAFLDLAFGAILFAFSVLRVALGFHFVAANQVAHLLTGRADDFLGMPLGLVGLAAVGDFVGFGVC